MATANRHYTRRLSKNYHGNLAQPSYMAVQWHYYHLLGASMQYKTVLIIGYVWPEPNSSAAGSRMMDLIRFFKARSQTVVFATPAQDSPHKFELASIGVQSQTIALNCSSFNDFCQQLSPDVVMFDRFMMEEQFGWRVEQACPQAMRLLDTEDLHCLRNARHQHLKQTGEMLATPSLAQLNGDLAQRELASIWRCDLTLMISPVEVQLLTQIFGVPDNLLHYSPLWITPYQQPLPSFDQRAHFVTIGSFRHAPNWDSVLWLNSEIWPAIRKQLPQAQLHIYGSYPPPKATALNNPKKGFHIKGWADDAFEVLAQARVCLAPLRFGAGIKGKFVDALQTGTPSVTTPIGSEGMFNQQTWPGGVASSSQELAEQAISLYQNAESWQSAHSQALNISQNSYQLQDCEAQLEAALETVSANLEAHRSNNFIGSMLRHHSLKSTQYMSQWIEQKNANQRDN